MDFSAATLEARRKGNNGSKLLGEMVSNVGVYIQPNVQLSVSREQRQFLARRCAPKAPFFGSHWRLCHTPVSTPGGDAGASERRGCSREKGGPPGWLRLFSADNYHKLSGLKQCPLTPHFHRSEISREGLGCILCLGSFKAQCWLKFQALSWKVWGRIHFHDHSAYCSIWSL